MVFLSFSSYEYKPFKICNNLDSFTRNLKKKTTTVSFVLLVNAESP